MPMFKRTPWAVVALVLAATAILLLTPGADRPLQASTPPKGPPPVPVRLATVERTDVPQSIEVVGQVQAQKQVVLRPRIESVVTQVAFSEGQVVRKGQVLLRLDDRDLLAREAQALAERQRLQAQLELARLELQRTEGLLAQAAVSAQQRDQQAAQAEQLKAQVAAQDAALQALRVQRSHATVLSPIDGRVGLRQVDEGNLVRPSDAAGLVTVVQSDPVALVFAVPQRRLSEVLRARDREQTALRVEALDRERGGISLAQGRLLAIDNQIDPATGSLRLKAELPNAQGRLWPGQYVTVRLATGQLDDVLAVPRAAVQRGLKGTLVWRIQGDVAQPVPVQVAWQDDERAVVSQGLAAGDRVVIDGHNRLKPGSRVKTLAGAGG